MRDMCSLRARVFKSAQPVWVVPSVVHEDEEWLGKGEVQCGAASGSLNCPCVRLDDNVGAASGSVRLTSLFQG